VRRLLFLPLLLATITLAGCAFNRADFVTGPDGQPKQSEMSETGKTVGSWLRWGPHLRLTF
jgi:hypothetical protein